MGQCYAKTRFGDADEVHHQQSPLPSYANGEVRVGGSSSSSKIPAARSTPSHSSTNLWPSPFPHSSATTPLPAGVSPSPARSTPGRRLFRRPFPPPSPAKHIKASLLKRMAPSKPKEKPIPEDGGANGGTPGAEEDEDEHRQLDRSFGYGKNFGNKYELGKEVGRGHFGHTCLAKVKKGVLKGQIVAVKIIAKGKVSYFLRFSLVFV